MTPVTTSNGSTLIFSFLQLTSLNENVCDTFDGLMQYHYIVKSQSGHLWSLKEDLPDNAAILLLDFAENYSFIVQDAVLGFYLSEYLSNTASICNLLQRWRDTALHECVYHIGLPERHDTITVHAFITKLSANLKDHLPAKLKLIFFKRWSCKPIQELQKICQFVSPPKKQWASSWMALFCHKPW